jgi:hypothetical protein
MTHRFSLFFSDVVGKSIRERVVVFVDEIDTTLALDFTDDFFAAIRALANARAQTRDLSRTSFVLIGVATPSDLVKDPERTPFNIGQRVNLTDFSAAEAEELLEGLNAPHASSREILSAVLSWTGGHPYLTLRVLRSLHDEPPSMWTTKAANDRVRALFLDPVAQVDTNIQFVRDMLTVKAPDKDRVLATYLDVQQDSPRPRATRSSPG